MDDQSDLWMIGCPECGAPAEVEPEGRLGSTSGPVAIVRVRCAERHWFLMAEDGLPAVPGGSGQVERRPDVAEPPGHEQPASGAERSPGTRL
jgi:hypothetical protein